MSFASKKSKDSKAPLNKITSNTTKPNYASSLTPNKKQPIIPPTAILTNTPSNINDHSNNSQSIDSPFIGIILKNHEHIMNTFLKNSTKSTATSLRQPFISQTSYSKERINNNKSNELNFKQIDCNRKQIMVRDIEMQIGLLEARVKQPGITSSDLITLKDQIYTKFDQFYLTNKPLLPQVLPETQQDTRRQKVTALRISSKKASRLPSISNSKVDSQTGSERHSPISQNSSKSKPKPNTCQQIVQKEQSCIDRRVYKTMTCLSVSRSLNSNVEQRPMVQTMLADEELAGLDRFAQRKMSQNEGDHHDSYIELKENVTIMEERICLLTHRVQESKREIQSLKQSNNRFEECFRDQQCKRKKIKEEYDDYVNEQEELRTKVKELEKQNKQMEKDCIELERTMVKVQDMNGQLNHQIQCLAKDIKKKDSQIGLLQNQVIRKSQELDQINQSLQDLQQQLNRVRKELREEIDQKDRQNKQLKNIIKQHKARLQTEGINLRYEEATKLQKFIQQNQSLHQRQIIKLDQTYSTIINKYQQQLRKIKNHKIELQNTLIQWIGLQTSKGLIPKKQSDQFESEILKLQAVELAIGNLTGEHIGKQFINMTQSYKLLKDEKETLERRLAEIQHKFQLMKEEYQDKYSMKCQEYAKINSKYEEARRIMKLISTEKDEVEQEIKELKMHIETPANSRSSVMNYKIESKNVHLNYPYSTCNLQKTEFTFHQFIIKQSNNITLKQKLMISLKIIDFALSLQSSKKKLPSLMPKSIILKFPQTNLSSIQITLCHNIKYQEQQGLIYSSPQVLLGFNETSYSHCWSIGTMLDELLHGKVFYKKFQEILCHKDNYRVRNDKYSRLDVLVEMMKKNHRQRIALQGARAKIEEYFNQQEF